MSRRAGTPTPQQPLPAESLAPGDDLIEAFRRTGAAADFERVVGRYAPLVFAECRRVTRDGHDAEDAAQLTFLALALAIELRSGSELRKPAAWLQRVSQRQALKLVRSRGRRRRREDAARKADHAPPQPLSPEIAERDHHAGQVRDAIDELPERYRLPLVLHYFGGLTLEGIATELGIKRQAVGTRLFRARKMLAERLADRGITMSDALVAAVAATLVPAAVLANLMKSGAPVIAQAAPSATFAHGVATLVGIAAGAAARRPAVAAAVLVMTATATGFAWVAPPNWTRAIRETLDVAAWKRWVAPPRPTLVPIRVPTPIAAEPASPAAHASIAFSRVPESTPLARHQPAGSISTTDAPQPPTIATTLGGGAFEPAVDLTPPPASLARIDVGWQPWRSTVAGDVPRGSKPTFKPLRTDRDVAHVGEATFGAVTVGDVGVGRLDLAGGKVKVAGLTIGAGVGSSGTLHVGDGTIEVTQPQTPVVVGGRGIGKLYLGTADAPGQIVASPGADAQLVVRATRRANGLIRGWGDVDAGGTLVNNGRIIADGFERGRALNLGRFETVTNTIENGRGGTNGWYARRGGRVVLPTLRFDADRTTATWGESADDPTIDLVNSVRVTVPAQARPGAMDVTLQTIGLHDPASTPLPVGVTVIGLFSVRSLDLDGDATFSVRYDHVAANAVFGGELGIHLLARVDGAWIASDDPALSLFNRIVTGTFASSIDLLAVAVGNPFALHAGTFRVTNTLDGLGRFASTRLTFFEGASLGVVPEPATLLGMSLLATLARRRRRR